MKKTPYFSHDANAREDPKIMAMRSIYGWQGYGWYWLFIENMREQQDYKLSIQGQYVFNAFAMQMQCESEVAEKFINDCINEFKLFKSNEKKFWSSSLIIRMGKMQEKSKKASESAKARWSKGSATSETVCEGNADNMRTHSECNANAMQIKESKVKESKVNKYIYSSLHSQLAEILVERIIINKPNFKTPSNLDSWSNGIRLMMDIDKRTYEQIESVIDWCQKDSFWQSNILSVKKLREKFDQLESKMKQKVIPQKQLSVRELDRERRRRLAEEYDRSNGEQVPGPMLGERPTS